MKGLLKRSLMLVGISSVAMLVAGEVLARPLSQIFVGYDQGLMNMTLRGFAIYSFSFLFAGIGIFGSAFFTALNNGLVSAIISFLRTLVFQVGGGVDSAPVLEAGRHMDVHGGGRAAGDCRDGSVFDKQAEAIPLLRKCRIKRGARCKIALNILARCKIAFLKLFLIF